MVEGSCHCGKVKIEIDTAPAEVTECNCSICRRYGALWAYYSPKQVRITEAVSTQSYLWNKRWIDFHRCTDCGCVTHWTAHGNPSADRMGVNMRMMPAESHATASLRRFDGASALGFTH